MAESPASPVRTLEEKQANTFTRWINSQFMKAHDPFRINNIAEDLQTGIALIKLMKAISPDLKLPAYNANPKMRPHKLDNLSQAFDMIKRANVKVIGVGQNDVLDGNTKLILGLIWTIVYAVQIGGIKGEDSKNSGKEGLLLWIQKATKGYEGLQVKNFTTSWKDGLCLAALIHHYRPDLVDFETIRGKEPELIIEQCFQAAQDRLGIPRLLEVDDMTVTADEKANMTYISEFFHAFAKAVPVEVSTRRVIKFVENIKAMDGMTSEYEAGMRQLLEWGNEKIAQLTNPPFEGTFLDAKEKMDAANSFHTKEKRDRLTQRRFLESVFGNIQTCNRTHNRPPYTAPADVNLDTVEHMWLALENADKQHMETVRVYYREQRDLLRSRYVDDAKQLHAWLEQKQRELNDVSGDLSEQLQAVETWKAEANENELFKVTEERVAQLTAGGISTADTDYMWEDLAWAWEQLKESLEKRKAFIEAQIAAKQASGSVPPERLAEYKETFALFDTNKTGTLNLQEFTNCLRGLGIAIPDEEIENLFIKYAPDGKALTFDAFIKFMTERTADTETEEELVESFACFSKSATAITEEELRRGMGDEAAEYLMRVMPRSGGGYDYRAYVASIYGKKPAQ
eukprot:TRINITY_DN1214_c0_g1_i1.p1 TRINITY_DN1214_c0_g1~~TRINITY_DN1214_c0_g1_i1.p1  ORF type:complete len:626 (-),score=135.76 TRINITY_DN1214_c0_g1_i1:96-1973(-)